MDGKVCEYSYLEKLGYFLNKDEFERIILEKEKKLLSLQNRDDYSKMYKMSNNYTYEVTVKNFNNNIKEI